MEETKEQKKQLEKEAKRERDYQAVVAKINVEFPIRQKLAKLAGCRPEDRTIIELFCMVQILMPDKVDEARALLKDYK